MQLAVIFLTTVCTVVLACCAQENIVAKLKAVIEQRLSVPVDQQTLYFQEQMMHNDSVLNRISGLDHGGMVYLSRQHFSLTIYSWLSGSLEKVQLKLSYNTMVMVWVEIIVVLTPPSSGHLWWSQMLHLHV